MPGASNVEGIGEGFDLLEELEREDCGTTCCLAGWTYAVAYNYQFEEGLQVGFEYDADYIAKTRGLTKGAAEFLGLTDAQAKDLFSNFTGTSIWHKYRFQLFDNETAHEISRDGYNAAHRVTPRIAAQMLRGLNEGRYVFDV